MLCLVCSSFAILVGFLRKFARTLCFGVETLARDLLKLLRGTGHACIGFRSSGLKASFGVCGGSELKRLVAVGFQAQTPSKCLKATP